MSNLAINGGSAIRSEKFPVWPVWGDEEIENLTRVIKSGKWGRLHGTVTSEFEKKYAEFQQAKHCICINSGTTALKIALLAADVDPGTEVIVPAYTFIATASAVVEMGGIPVFVDIDPNTYNIDPAKIEAAITDKTSAIMPVHFAGRPADMDAILAIAKKHNLKVVEDAAQAWGAEWKGTRMGAIGDAGCFSFQSSKNINSGEGGAIVTNDDEIARMSHSHSNCGRSEDGMWYEHFYFGGNYRITELQAAVLMAQLGRYEEQLKIRQENHKYLDEKLAKIDGIEPLITDDRITSHACHIYIFRYKKDGFNGAEKKRFIEALNKEGIPASPGYSIPLYNQPVFEKLAFGPRGKSVELDIDYSTFKCPETEVACYDESIWLTQNVLLGTTQDMDDIVAAISKIKENSTEL